MNEITFKHNGYTVRIMQDQEATTPDEYGDDNVILVTTRNRYFERLHNGNDANTVDEDGTLAKTHWAFPVFAYIHSGIALSLGRGGQFSDPWDSGRIGTLYLAKSEWRYRTRETKKSWSAESYAKCHIEEWSQYLSGDVWGFDIETPDGAHVDSCWGFYGYDYAVEQAKEAVPAEPASVGGESEDETMEATLA